MSDEKAVLNTDREIWRERPDDFYADSIHVTEGNGIGLNVGGHVIVKPIREWFNLAELGDGEPSPPPDANGISKETLLKIRRQLLHRLDLVDKKLARSGAAQEVSPRARAMKIAKEIDQECIHQDDMGHTFEVSRAAAIIEKEYGVEAVSPPSPPQETLTHSRSCHYWDSEEGCTCSLDVRIELQTEQTMHNAWRKRAEEAEGDTRELKAALQAIINGSWTAEGMFSPCHICRPSNRITELYEWREVK